MVKRSKILTTLFLALLTLTNLSKSQDPPTQPDAGSPSPDNGGENEEPQGTPNTGDSSDNTGQSYAERQEQEGQYSGKNGYLRSEWFEVDTKSTDSYIFIHLKHLDSMFARSRREYIRDLVNRHRRNLIRIESTDERIVRKMFNYIPHENLNYYARGIIPVQINNVHSYESADLRVGIKTDYHIRRNLEQGPELGHKNTNSWDNNNQYPPYGYTENDRKKILTDEESHKVHWSANWVQIFDISGLFTIIGYISRGFIIVAQFFLVGVRPCTAKKDTKYYHWSISFASSMLHFQFFLLFGLIAENFGGPLNTVMEKMLITSKSRFFGYMESEYAKYFDDDFEDAGYWKLVEAKYVASPIYENYVGLGLLMFSILACHCLSGAQGSSSNSLMKKFRIGCSLAFMIPLLVSSCNCIYAVFTSGIYTLGAVFSLIASFGLLVYYLIFGFEIMAEHKKSMYYKSSYDHINFDFLPGFAKKNFRHFEFFCMWLLTIAIVFGANLPIVPISLAAFFYMIMVIMDLVTPRHERIRDKFLELKRVHSLKVALYTLRMLFFTMLFIFIFFRTTTSSMGIKAMTLIAYIALIADFVLNWAIFVFRVAGMWKDGVSKRVEGYDGDPDGPYVELNKEQEMAVKAAKLYAKHGGMA